MGLFNNTKESMSLESSEEFCSSSSCGRIFFQTLAVVFSLERIPISIRRKINFIQLIASPCTWRHLPICMTWRRLRTCLRCYSDELCCHPCSPRFYKIRKFSSFKQKTELRGYIMVNLGMLKGRRRWGILAKKFKYMVLQIFQNFWLQCNGNKRHEATLSTSPFVTLVSKVL